MSSLLKPVWATPGEPGLVVKLLANNSSWELNNANILEILFTGRQEVIS